MQSRQSKVFLIPAVLHEDPSSLAAIPPYIVDAIKACSVFFVENERTTRRYFKQLWREMVIDNYKWYTIHKAEDEVKASFLKHLKQGDVIGIVSEAGCPGIADPGQILVNIAQQHGAEVKPLVGPSSILLALMASGMNGQQFKFHGYLPIESHARKQSIKEIEALSAGDASTHIFIETPYRNNQLLSDILVSCKPNTRICVAVDITAPTESIRTLSVADWKKEKVDLHKRPAIFLLQA